MKYLCLVYIEEKVLNAMPQHERIAVSDESMAYCDALQKQGQLLAASPLHPVDTATTVRVRDGKTTTTDGPFAETKEQLGGYLLIDVRDLNLRAIDDVELRSNELDRNELLATLRRIWLPGRFFGPGVGFVTRRLAAVVQGAVLRFRSVDRDRGLPAARGDEEQGCDGTKHTTVELHGGAPSTRCASRVRRGFASLSPRAAGSGGLASGPRDPSWSTWPGPDGPADRLS